MTELGKAPPSCNTGGTSITPPTPQAAAGGQIVICDTVAFTTKGVIPKDSEAPRSTKVDDILEVVRSAFPGSTWSDETHGRQGFKFERQLLFGNLVLGWVDWGAQHGWTWVYIGGAGLRFRRSRGGTDEAFPDEMENLDPRWSRVDLALDVYDKETYSVEQAMQDYKRGMYQLPKSPTTPWSKLIQSGRQDDERLARTFYVGKPASGKQIRIYDKGLQVLGSMTLEQLEEARVAGLVPCEAIPDGAELEDWVRLEVQYNKGERVLTGDLMVYRDQYFAGAYPACEAVLGRADGIRPSYVPDDEDVEVAWLVSCLKQSYGGVVFHLSEAMDWTDARIIKAVKGDKSAKRICTIRETAVYDITKTGWGETPSYEDPADRCERISRNNYEEATGRDCPF